MSGKPLLGELLIQQNLVSQDIIGRNLSGTDGYPDNRCIPEIFQGGKQNSATAPLSAV